MRKLIFISSIILVLSASCKKYRTCECTSSGTILSTPYNDTNTEVSPDKLSKSQAKSWCKSFNEPETDDGQGTKVKTECELK